MRILAPLVALFQLLRILNTLSHQEQLPVKIPFPLDLLTVRTRGSDTLSHCLDACKVSSDIVFEAGIGLWKTQLSTEDSDNFAAMETILQENLLWKSHFLWITFFRKVLDDTCSDRFHGAILDHFKLSLPRSALALHRPSLERHPAGRLAAAKDS